MPRELPPLNALRAFEAAARLGGMSQAAEELNVTHGAVSRQVRLLEEHLAVELFIKDGRGVKLTDAGQRLSEVAADSFERVRLACSDIRRQAGEDAPFVLGCPGSLLARWFIPRLDRLQRDLPELRLQLSASEELDPRRSGQDATLWFAEPPWPADMQVHELAPERIGPVLSPRHARFAELAAAAPERLLGEPLLHTTSRPQAWPQWAGAQGLADAALRLGQGFEHLYYLLEAAVAGLGVAIAPQALVADDLAAGRLAAPWGFQQTRASLALWVPARLPDRRAARLAQWLRGELGVKG